MMLIARPIHRFPGLCSRFCVKVRHVIRNYVLWLGCYVGLHVLGLIELWYSSVAYRVTLIVVHVNSRQPDAWFIDYLWVAVENV